MNKAERVQIPDHLPDEMYHHVNMEGVQRVQVQVKRRRSKKLYLLIAFFLCVFMGGTLFGVVEFMAYDGMYHRDKALADTGMLHLQRAEALLVALSKNPLDASRVAQAQHEFASGSMALVKLNNDLKSLPGYSTSIPVYGSRLSAALRLTPLAITLAQAGVTSCALLNLFISRVRNPLDVQGQGLTQSDLTLIRQDLHQVKSALDVVANEASRLQPADIQSDPRIEHLLSKLHKDIPALQGAIANTEQFLTFAPALLGIGKPANYLIELLDTTELRPGGGFIGNYGITTLSGGRLTAAHVTDAYVLDRSFEATGKSIAYPPGYAWFPLAPAGWSFRDSNLDADFPTAAQNGEQNYKLEGGTVPVQGVVAITPAFIQQALALTGPIKVPEYGEVVTAQNLIDRIHYHQLGVVVAGKGSSHIPPNGTSQRKQFISLLAEHFLARVHQLPPSVFPRLLQLVINSLRAKDVQIYFNSSAAVQYLAQNHLDDSIQKSTGDSFMIVDANVSPNKANSLIVNTLNDQAVIDQQGDVTHHTTLTYAWATNNKLYGTTLYQDYVRIYVPDSSSLLTQDGWQFQGKSFAFGHQVWAGWFTLIDGQTGSISLTWTVHHAVKHDANGWHYLYMLQRQAAARWILHLRIKLPSCSVLTNAKEGPLSYSKQM
ncbi:MAG TPA: DUF4012 domain-containing protein, partial [Ktedonobacteraceae bacterium]